MAKQFDPKDNAPPKRTETWARQPDWKKDRYEARKAKSAIRSKHGSF